MKFFQFLPLLLVFVLVSLRPILGHSVEAESGSSIRCLERERQALLKFKDNLVDTYGRLASWGNGKKKRECCKWRGILCNNQTNHVTQLDLHNENGDPPLKGTISNSLLELQYLQYLNLNHNDFNYAPIPEFIGSLSELRHLNLAEGNFSGPIPYQLVNLSKLSYLDLGENPNCYSKSLDWISHLHSLEYLDLSSINLSNATNWLQAISKLAFIKELHVSGSKLPDIPRFSQPSINGSTPLATIDLSSNYFEVSTLALIDWFSNFSSTGLTSIDLNYNNMPGPIPDVFEDMTSLASLSLFETGLEGGIPNFFGNMSSLIYLDLGRNSLTGEFSELMMNLSGPIEKNLRVLKLVKNRISGSFYNMSRFSSLEELVLWENQLNGSIQEGYLKLPHLVVLDLSSNPSITVKFSPHWVPPFQLQFLVLRKCKLGPHFPLWLKTQKELFYIDISSAGISDVIPSWFWFGGAAPHLLYLNASNNQLNSVLPQFPLSPIFYNFPKILDLSRNKISGSIINLCHIGDWEIIDLSDNLLSDQIPDCFTPFKGLKFLNLANNNFSGELPYSFGSLSALYVLHLRNNSFSGGLPTSMANCTNLIMIDMGRNRLTGKIPSWIGERFSQLKVLILRSNKFYGSIPSTLCGLVNVQILDLSSNKISGVIPNCVHKYIAMTGKLNETMPSITSSLAYTRYTYQCGIHEIGAYFMWKGIEVKYTNNLGLVKVIDLSSNNLSGGIPSEITKLVGLVQLNLSTNNLTGSIPDNIGALKSLDSLDFSRNHLSGGIPTSLSELSFLGVLNLSYNNFSGRIPQSPKLLTFDKSTYMGNSGLCGYPLNKSCLGDESHHDSNSNADGNNTMSKEESKDDGFITKEFYIALGLGFIVGFWGIFGTILFNKAMRDAFFKVYNIVKDFVCIRAELTKALLLRYFQNG